MNRRVIAAAAVLALGLAACGGGDEGEDLLEEDGLRECLADRGLTIGAADPTRVGLGSVSADFEAVTAEDVAVRIVVQGSERKAQRTAADIRGALQSFGAAGSEVIDDRNAIAVIDGEPSEESRQAVEDCLAA